MAKNERVFKGLAMKDMLSIFSINVAGEIMKFYHMSKESGIYKNCLLTQAQIPLYLSSTETDNVYSLLHALLTFRTSIACTVRNILYHTDASTETLSNISSTSDMSISTVPSPPSSPSSYRTSSPKPRRKRSKMFEN